MKVKKGFDIDLYHEHNLVKSIEKTYKEIKTLVANFGIMPEKNQEDASLMRELSLLLTDITRNYADSEPIGKFFGFTLSLA